MALSRRVATWLLAGPYIATVVFVVTVLGTLSLVNGGYIHGLAIYGWFLALPWSLSLEYFDGPDGPAVSAVVAIILLGLILNAGLLYRAGRAIANRKHM